MSEENQNTTPEQQNTSPQSPPPASEDKKVLAGILAILLGSLGIHKFVLGYQKEGIILLVITVVTCGFGAMVTSIIGLIEGIIYLTKSDEEFRQTYVTNKKAWF
ncbi:TM2 domain-containing protein [Akkermansiaceae bacterium]|nr:TM2 domain-containing protein [Akkermansiaceae bacterium]MDB4277359.1 TM2 domain-containing protein [bacterium]MDA7650971.1 TM2 domain-containing protein [Akkermansiaceae bacterium]MDA7863378.1 TM2 domain-containing protein [Akkermansiaceae bacterium]MDA8876292.1 TM2 domain-containing protein [Akkermansiaceae bacterium]